MTISFEEARPEDLPQLVELLHILFTQEHELSPDAARQERALRLILGNPAIGRIHVARDAERVLGMVNILRTTSTAEGGPAGHLEDFVVRPEARRSGLGARLLAYAIERARSDGLLRLILLTDGDNAAAQRLYERAGFTRSGMLPMRLTLR
ncbi:MAG: GNAT family N-acetyltransferase [Betaproteobacteria bacterium]|nr:GNAT family N-acetyltransferase [Betaproteobacteria bacterium]